MILNGGIYMKKVLYAIITTVLFTPYILAYGIAHLFKIEDRENMPTAKEWFEVLRNV